MKTNIKTLTTLLLLAFLTVTNFSCKKDPGPKGDTGATGPAGPTGNANVKNFNITIGTNDWTWDNLYKEWYYNYNVSESSQSAIYAYTISGNGEEVMPYYSQIYLTTTSFSSYLFNSTPYIMFKYYNGTTSLAKPSISTFVRLVIIPPAMMKPNVNYHNYSDVKAAYNLAD
jgi:hypothetical protein